MINLKNRKNLFFGIILLATILVFSFGKFNSFAEAQTNQNTGGGEIASVNAVTVCCEKTKKGLACLDVPESECDPAVRKLPTSCESSAFCKPGFCFDTEEGTCLDNTAQIVCNENRGTWSASKPPQCNLGCCVLGEQGSFVTLTRCEKLSSFYGLNVNFNPNIQSQEVCILTASAKERGACVYIKNFRRTCKLTTREDCNTDFIYSGVSSGGTNKKETKKSSPIDLGKPVTKPEEKKTEQGGTTEQNKNTGTPAQNTQQNPLTGKAIDELKEGEVKFYAGKLCSAEELGTDCGPSKQTTCLAGKEEVYFVDTCGNPANIYDASKINNDEYWANIKDKSEVCNPNSANENSQTCGNCNYLLGSYCRESSSIRPTYGDNICSNLNCKDFEGKDRLHGESWCGFDRKESQGTGKNPVGSKFYRYICNNGKIVVEPCADFRQEECIEDSIKTSKGKFSQAACRVNRWQDCTAQKEMPDCLNTDKRDCKWLEGIEYVLIGAATGNGSTLEGNSLAQVKQSVKEAGGIKNMPKGACVPENPPGLRFWEGGEATAVCAQANAICPVTYEKRLVGGDWECEGKSCACLEASTQLKRAELCMSMGDCGPNVNYLGRISRNKGYKITEEDLEKKK